MFRFKFTWSNQEIKLEHSHKSYGGWVYWHWCLCQLTASMWWKPSPTLWSKVLCFDKTWHLRPRRLRLDAPAAKQPASGWLVSDSHCRWNWAPCLQFLMCSVYRPINSASRKPRWLAFLALAMTLNRDVILDRQTTSLHLLEVFKWRVIPLSDFATFRTCWFASFSPALSSPCSVVNVTFFPWFPPSALALPWFSVVFFFFFFFLFFGSAFWDSAAVYWTLCTERVCSYFRAVLVSSVLYWSFFFLLFLLFFSVVCEV